jgi:CRP/FNR family cyclic AMP-dependent transcriptional regulator
MLEKIELFKTVSHGLLGKMESAAALIEPASNARLFVQSDIADAVYVVVAGEGHVRIGATDQNGKSLMIELFALGELFGEIAVIDGSTRTADAVVQGRVKLLRIPGTAFLDLLRASPELGIGLCRMMASRLRRTFELFQSASFEPLESRLARQLIYLAELSGSPAEHGTRLNGRYRQSDLADLLGVTPRSIISLFNIWRSSEILHYDATQGVVVLRDKNALRAIFASDSPQPLNRS